jgi:drug/metabolite transporter (DMT)-like permease
LGIIFIQIEHANRLSLENVVLGIVPVLIASFAYPLGNRKMMELCGGRLDTFERVLGMTLASLPFWFILSIYGFYTVGLPSNGQIFQSLLVALFSGVVATVLFFKATDMARGNMQKLASVESTQSMEVLFTLAGELLFLSASIPSPLAWCGILIVVLGMILHSYYSNKNEESNLEKSVA